MRHHPLEDRGVLDLTFGYMVIAPARTGFGQWLLHLRTRPHLRNMGLARRALRVTLSDPRFWDLVPAPAEDKKTGFERDVSPGQRAVFLRIFQSVEAELGQQNVPR
jgi:hypothetical protein